MLACSYCSSVLAPSWWSTVMPLALVVSLAVGLVVLWTAVRGKGRRRVGGLFLAVALVAVLPLSALVAGRSDTQVDVVGTRPPADASAWSVRCVTVFQPTEAASALDAEFISACGDATRSQRWTAYALVLLAAAFTVPGGVARSTTKPSANDSDLRLGV